MIYHLFCCFWNSRLKMMVSNLFIPGYSANGHRKKHWRKVSHRWQVIKGYILREDPSSVTVSISFFSLNKSLFAMLSASASLQQQITINSKVKVSNKKVIFVMKCETPIYQSPIKIFAENNQTAQFFIWIYIFV